MKRLCHICFTFIFLCHIAGAQSYYPVTHTGGKKVIGGVEVEVKGIDSPKIYNLSPNCGAIPFHIGDLGAVRTFTFTNGYSFRFSKPPRAVRFQVTYSDYGERLMVQLNDTAYKLSTAELSSYLGSCGNNGHSNLNAGEVTFDSATSSNNTQITISGKEIHSVTLSDIITQGGSVFGFQFAFDTTVSIVNYTDTLLCVGDTMHISYEITGTFLPGNTFTFQLSDKNGSFTNPTVLGSVADTGNGVFKCEVPSSLISAGNYHIRMVSSLPSYTSVPNEIAIGIGHPPQFTTFTSAPACENDTIVIGTVNFSHVSGYSWEGPSVVKGYPAQHVRIPNAKMKDGGMYNVSVYDYGCVVKDSVYVLLNANPLHSIGSSNSPICTGDTLKLISKIDTPAVVNTWETTNGATFKMNALIIPNAQMSDTGTYILTTVLNGCTARDTSFVIVRQRPQPHPVVPDVCAGDSLVIGCTYFPSGQYQWNGPGGFTSNSQTEVIPEAKVSNSGYYIIAVTNNGCTGKDSVEALVKPMPETPLAKTNSPACEGGLLHLYIDKTMQNTIYTWTGSDSSVITGSDVKTSSGMAGTKQYIVQANLDGCFASDTAVVVVNHTPAVPVIKTNVPLKLGADLYLKIDTPETGVGYAWTGPNGFKSLVFDPVIKKVEIGNSGTYVVTASLYNCLSTASVYIDVAALIDSDVLVLYPNPNDGNFTIKGTLRNEQQVSIRIVNTLGAAVYTALLQTRDKRLEFRIDLKDNVSSGIYYLLCTIDSKKHCIPFVIDRNR